MLYGKRALIILLLSQISYCPDDLEESTEQQHPSSLLSARYKALYGYGHTKSFVSSDSSKTPTQEVLELEKEKNLYKSKIKNLKSRDLQQLSHDWEESIAEDEEYLRNGIKSKKKVSFAKDISEKKEFDPQDIDSWDLNRIKKLDGDDAQKLSQKAILKLLSHSDYLKKLSKDFIENLNPQELSKALYYALPDKLNLKFVHKLSEAQIIDLFKDHIAWGFKNFLTSFKKNFSSDAFEYMQKIYQEDQERITELAKKNEEEDQRDPSSLAEPLNRF